MPKNVVLCCDGTANEFAQDRTNVVKLYFTLDPNPARQVTYYHPGLGTMEPPGALTGVTRVFTRFAGRAFGYGLEADIRDAYIFLMNNFEEGDRVFLFGFSRGAYTARAVASLLRMYGLIPRGNDALVPYAVRLLMGIHAIDSRGRHRCAEEKRYFNLAADFKSTFATRVCKPWFVGVWDTVSSIGWYENPLQLPFTGDNPDIEIGRHAIAIDERRAFFRTNLWIPKEPAAVQRPARPQAGLVPGCSLRCRWRLSGTRERPFQDSRCAGCSRRLSMPVFSSFPDAWISCSAEAAPMPCPIPMPKMHESLTGLLVAGRSSVEAPLQLGQAKVGAPAPTWAGDAPSRQTR